MILALLFETSEAVHSFDCYFSSKSAYFFNWDDKIALVYTSTF